MMEKRPISELMETTMQKVREMVDANTIVGEMITTPDGVTLIPISKLSFGFAGGGADFAKKQEPTGGFGGGIGAGVKIEPVAFIIVRGENVRLLHVSPPSASTVDRIVDAVPVVLDKVTELVMKDKDKDKDKDKEKGKDKEKE